MKRAIYIITAFAFLISTPLFAQDEGTIEKRERITKSSGLFLNFGPSFTLGKNIGDYSTGFSFEGGFMKRVNRVLSIGPSLSYLSFKYDPEATTANGGGAYVDFGDPNDWATKYDIPGLEYDYGYVLTLEGGDITVTSLAFNIKLNLIPVRDESKFSIYVFAKPFIASATRTEVSGSDERYTYEIYEDDNGTATINDDYLYAGDEGEYYSDGTTSTWGADSYEALAEETSFTGGIFLGPGIEISPAKSVSVFAQASFGYTLPISMVSTKSYEPTVDSYIDEEFPMVKKGFPSVNLQLGVSFNF
jgi:hypothetical protein